VEEVEVEAGRLPEASAPCPIGFDGVLSNDAILLSCPTVDGVLQQRTTALQVPAESPSVRHQTKIKPSGENKGFGVD
jgi:hypothetical protein